MRSPSSRKAPPGLQRPELLGCSPPWEVRLSAWSGIQHWGHTAGLRGASQEEACMGHQGSGCWHCGEFPPPHPLALKTPPLHMAPLGEWMALVPGSEDPSVWLPQVDGLTWSPGSSGPLPTWAAAAPRELGCPRPMVQCQPGPFPERMDGQVRGAAGLEPEH